jgi:hypothetical protein
MPLASVVVDAKTSDSKMLIPCLEQLNNVEVELPNMVADMGYIDGDNKITAMKDYGTAVCTEVKKNMIRPEVCDEKGPQFFGPIGQGSELQERMLRLRKQSKLNFALEANLLDNVLHNKKLTVRGVKRAEIFF